MFSFPLSADRYSHLSRSSCVFWLFTGVGNGIQSLSVHGKPRAEIRKKFHQLLDQDIEYSLDFIFIVYKLLEKTLYTHEGGTRFFFVMDRHEISTVSSYFQITLSPVPVTVEMMRERLSARWTFIGVVRGGV